MYVSIGVMSSLAFQVYLFRSMIPLTQQSVFGESIRSVTVPINEFNGLWDHGHLCSCKPDSLLTSDHCMIIKSQINNFLSCIR